MDAVEVVEALDKMFNTQIRRRELPTSLFPYASCMLKNIAVNKKKSMTLNNKREHSVEPVRVRKLHKDRKRINKSSSCRLYKKH